MTEPELRNRSTIMAAVFIGALLICSIRLFFLQIVIEEYALESEAVDLEDVVLLPSRGIVYDRNEKIFVKNSPLYEVLFIPKTIAIAPNDTSILEECLGLTRKYIHDEITRLKKDYERRLQWAPLKKQVSQEMMAKFAENQWKFQGLSIKARQKRDYNYKSGAHFLGYINQVDSAAILKDEDKYYESGDLIGKTGIEKSYEDKLRGIKGTRTVLKDNFNREVGSYAEGIYDKLPEQGRDILLGIDANLQVFGESLMVNKRGSIVAIEPSTGEILCFVSAPSYDPTLLTGSELGKNHKILEKNDSLIPLFNRPIQGQYAPGSVFKILQALCALSEGLIDSTTRFPCGGAWFRNNGRPACHGAHGSIELKTAIQVSCNAWFAENYYQLLNANKYGGVRNAYVKWREVMSVFGCGRKLGIDIPEEKSGNIPLAETYEKRKYWKWSALTIYSNSIGQGEVSMTPLQMCNAMAMIANRGFYFSPHFVKAHKPLNGTWEYKQYPKTELPNKNHPEHFRWIINAMEQAVAAGTGTMAILDSIVVCGKTGTAENPPYEDHSVFVAFAPKDNPKIAISVIVENAGWGGSWAAPIASLIIERYLTHKTKDAWKVQRILEANFLKKKILPKKK